MRRFKCETRTLLSLLALLPHQFRQIRLGNPTLSITFRIKQKSVDSAVGDVDLGGTSRETIADLLATCGGDESERSQYLCYETSLSILHSRGFDARPARSRLR